MNDPESGVVSVKIYDREYALRTTGDPDRLRSLCMHLDTRMRGLATSSGSVDTLRVAVLAALSFAEEIYRSREALEKMNEIVGRRSLACVSVLDRFLC